MATSYNYIANSFKDPAVVLPSPGMIVRRATYSVTAGSQLETDNNCFYFFKLPKGAKPLYGRVTAVADPDGGTNLKLAMEIADDAVVAGAVAASPTSHCSVVATTAVQAANTSIVSTAADYAAMGVYVTPDDDEYVYVRVETPAAGSGGNATTIIAEFGYTMLTEQGEIS